VYFGVLMEQTWHCGVNFDSEVVTCRNKYRSVIKEIIILGDSILVLKQLQTVNKFSNYCESKEGLSGLQQYWNLQEACAQYSLQQSATCTELIILYYNKYADNISQCNAVFRTH
jgi:hypothetical protein